MYRMIKKILSYGWVMLIGNSISMTSINANRENDLEPWEIGQLMGGN